MAWPAAQALQDAFDARLADPAAYERLADAQAATFPEGELFPYALLVVAYTNVARADVAEQAHSREVIGHLLDALVPRAEARFGDLARLEDYQDNATWLGWVGVSLGCYRLVGGDDRYEPDRHAVIDVLHEGLVRRGGFPLASYPRLTWSFDTIPVLLALRIDDALAHEHVHDDVIEDALRWQDRNGDGPTGLPHSRLDAQRPDLGDPPRGSDLSLRIQLLGQLDPVRAERTWGRYVDSHWRTAAGLSGFAEWPRDVDRAADIDSGPIVFGFGSSASGMGIGAARAVGDRDRERTLANELGIARAMLPTLGDGAIIGLGVPLDVDAYETGFLYGDVALFASITWADWGLVTPEAPPLDDARARRRSRRAEVRAGRRGGVEDR